MTIQSKEEPIMDRRQTGITIVITNEDNPKRNWARVIRLLMKEVNEMRAKAKRKRWSKESGETFDKELAKLQKNEPTALPSILFT